LVSVGGLSSKEASTADAAFARADRYYFASISRVQRLWQAVKQPHGDLSAGEIQAAQRFSEHILHLQRCHRRVLASAWQSHADLARLSTTLAALSAGPQLPPQKRTLSAATAQRHHLDQLVVTASSMASLASCAAEAETSATAHAALASVTAVLSAASLELTAAKLALDAALTHQPDGAVGDALAGVASPALATVVADNKAVLCSILSKLSSMESSSPRIPGLRELQSTLSAAVESMHAHGNADEVKPELQPAMGDFSSSYEAAVRAVLMWAQTVKVVTRPLFPHCSLFALIYFHGKGRLSR
jgi:midasin